MRHRNEDDSSGESDNQIAVASLRWNCEGNAYGDTSGFKTTESVPQRSQSPREWANPFLDVAIINDLGVSCFSSLDRIFITFSSIAAYTGTQL